MKNLTAKSLALTGILTAICAVANLLSINIVYPIFILSFTALACFISGAVLNPFLAFIAGFGGDFIAFILFNSLGGAYNIFIGISSGLLALIPCLFLTLYSKFCIKKTAVKTAAVIAFSFLTTYIICTAFINTFALWFMYAKGKKSFFAYLFARIPYQLIVTAINLILSEAVYFLMKKSLILKKYLYVEKSENSIQCITESNLCSTANENTSKRR